ncbi:hypothetical protein O181_011062 [Austropuccinia psidii MF-1]|uniref:CCHC-type domain-containing protein n=1 Tax=Austropuccinia psidii MF-1 TaxID=1389203 RepID=A0A9Q3BUZ9_9BASI|nr:hypothetical protein [Austropuccinia psidii MF-1]
MEDIITRPRIGKMWTRNLMESKIVPTISREDKRCERPVLKCHKCASTSHLAKICTEKAEINEIQIIEEAQYAGEKEESYQDFSISEDQQVEDPAI